MARPGIPLKLTLQLWDKDESKHVRCTLRKPDGDELAGSPVTLTHAEGGFYCADGAAFPFGTEFVSAFYEVFDDLAMTTKSDDHNEAHEVFSLEREEANDSSFITAIVGQVQLGM